MIHCTLEQLIEVRDGGSEPGLAEARAHLSQCDACAAELDQLLTQWIPATLRAAVSP